MRKTMQSFAAFAAIVVIGASIGYAQGADIYKTKCASCHGATGVPSAGMAKALGVKPATDPSVKSKTEAQMIAITTNGQGKMPAYKGKLSDDEIKQAVESFRAFAK